ncbi:hypothetical protein ASJ79_05745 [Mycobacterium sp. NAZ190054]|nr:hypothetical protein ASJ79_05745 [Mycobacterium sp. NAZ190054]
MVAAASAPLIALPVVGSVPYAEAEFSFLPDKARVLTLSLLPGGNDDDLRGEVCSAQRECSSVPYPYLLRTHGVSLLDTALRQPMPDPEQSRQIVFGYSQGARVAVNWIEEYGGTEGAPGPEDLSFVLIGNPTRKHGGAHVGWGEAVPETDYEVLDVARQYDLAADFPDKLHLLALANVFAGFAFVHADYEDVDLHDPANYVWTEGKTTYVFVPTENLPLLEPLRWVGLTGLADALNGPLKEIVESAYDRSYLPARPGMPAEPEPEPEPEEPPTEPEPEPEEPPTDPEPEDGSETAQLVSVDDDPKDDAKDVEENLGSALAGQPDEELVDEPAEESEQESTEEETEEESAEEAEQESTEEAPEDEAPDDDEQESGADQDSSSDGGPSGDE